MAYEKQTWKNGEEGGTPITAERLNHIEEGIAEKSEKGDAGKAATISIDSVETVEPGEEAKIENTGSKQNAKLKFTIPKGAQGEPGENPFTEEEVAALKALIENENGE